jgi:hypothetical protein
LVEQYDDIEIQRWRSITVEAVFEINQEVELVFNDQLTSAILKYENIFTDAFPNTPFKFLGFKQRLLIPEIVKRARQLSYNIQHDFVCRRLFVTIGLDSEAQDEIYGTYAFGLKWIRGFDCKVLINPELVTEEVLEGFFL